MAKKWSEVIKNPEYLKLSIEDQKFAQEQYFREVVQPQVSEEDIPAAREQFFTHISKPELPPEVMSDAANFHQLSFEEQTKIIGKESPFKSTDVSTITGRPTAELDQFPDYMKVGDIAADAAPPVVAIVGGILGLPVGGPAGGVAGAGLGGMTGETIKQAWYESTGRGETAENMSEYLSRIGKSGLEEMAWESVGLVASIPFRMVRGLGRAGKKTLEQYKNLGDIPPLTIGESLEQGTFKRRIVETIETLGTLGKHNINKARKAEIVGDAVKARLHKGIERNEELGSILYKIINDEDTAWKELNASNYARVEGRLINHAKESGKSLEFISTKQLKKTAQGILHTAEQAGVGGEVVTELKRIIDMKDFIAFDVAKLRWGAMYSTADTTLKKQLRRMGDSFKDGVGKQLKGIDKDIYSNWKTADKVYKEGKELFDEKIIKEIMHGISNDDLYKYLIQPNNADNINRIKKLMSGEVSEKTRSMFTSNWKKLQIVAHNKLIENATDVEGVLGGKRLKTGIKKMGSTFDAVFDPKDVSTATLNIKTGMEDLADYLTKLETRSGKVTLTSLLVTAPFVGAAGYGLVSEDEPITGLILKGGAVVATAATFAALSRTKTGLKILKEFARTPVTSVEKGVALTLRANRFLERREKREAWLEQREEKRTSERKETVQPEQPITKRPIDFLRGILPTQHPKTKPIINQTVGGTRASLGGNNDFLTQLLLS